MKVLDKTNDIIQYFHCGNCLKDLPEGMSASKWSRIEVGWTVKGLQVRCMRCDADIVNLDFKGQKVRKV